MCVAYLKLDKSRESGSQSQNQNANNLLTKYSVGKQRTNLNYIRENVRNYFNNEFDVVSYTYHIWTRWSQ